MLLLSPGVITEEYKTLRSQRGNDVYNEYGLYVVKAPMIKTV